MTHHLTNIGGFNPPNRFTVFWLDGLINGLGSIIGAGINAGTSKYATDKSIAAQKELNQRNIDFSRWATQYNAQQQKDINQQNIAFQQQVNDLMRLDQHSQKTNLVRDLKNAGLSTALAGDQAGFATATLGSPQLNPAEAVTPQLESELSPAAVNGIFNTGSAISNTVSQISSIIADNRKKAAEAKNTEISNAYLDENLQLQNDKLNAEVDNALADTGVKKETANKIKEEVKQVEEQTNILRMQFKQVEFETEHQQERFEKDMAKLGAEIASALSQRDVNEAQKKLIKAQERMQQIKNDYAKQGINFDNPGDWFAALTRLVANPKYWVPGAAVGQFVSETIIDGAKSTSVKYHDSDDIIYDPARPDSYKYYIDGKQVSEEEYNNTHKYHSKVKRYELD